MAYEIGIFALACPVAVFSPVAFRAKFFTSRAGKTGLAFAPAVHGVTGGLVMAVTLVGAIRPKGTRGTG